MVGIRTESYKGQAASSPNDIEHYGRLGMKWGQHIFGRTPEKYYEKGANRLLKYEKKSSKQYEKSNATKNKYYDAQVKSQSSLLFRKSKAKKAAKTARKAYRQESKGIMFENKAQKFATKMTKTFMGIKLGNIDPTLKAVGEKYANMTISDINNKSKTATQFLRDSMNTYGTVESYNKFRESMENIDAYKYKM